MHFFDFSSSIPPLLDWLSTVAEEGVITQNIFYDDHSSEEIEKVKKTVKYKNLETRNEKGSNLKKQKMKNERRLIYDHEIKEVREIKEAKEIIEVKEIKEINNSSMRKLTENFKSVELKKKNIVSWIESSSQHWHNPLGENEIIIIIIIIIFILFHFILFYFISFYFISFYNLLFYFISFYFISFYFILFHFILFYFISFHFILFHFILFYFI